MDSKSFWNQTTILVITILFAIILNTYMTHEMESHPRTILAEEFKTNEKGIIGVDIGFVNGNRGPCGGVNMSIETTHTGLLRLAEVNKLLKLAGKQPVEAYTTNPIVHYDPVMEEFKNMGLHLVSDVRDIPKNSLIFWSAHGHTPEDDRIAAELGCETIDTKCQLVRKPELIVQNAARRGDYVVYLGGRQKNGDLHPEPRGIKGHAVEAYNAAGFENRFIFIESQKDIQDIEIPENQKVEFITQTTFSTRETYEAEKSAIEKWDKQLIIRRGICHATDNRQNEVIDVAKKGNIDMFIVVGTLSKSHNTKELANCAQEFNIPVIGAEDDSELSDDLFPINGKIKRIAITSGASVPDMKGTIRVINWFHKRGTKIVYLDPLTDENVESFKKPEADIKRVDEWLRRKIYE